MATHSSVLAWRIPGMGKPGGLLSMGSHRVRHNWSDLAAAAEASTFEQLRIPLNPVFHSEFFLEELIWSPRKDRWPMASKKPASLRRGWVLSNFSLSLQKWHSTRFRAFHLLEYLPKEVLTQKVLTFFSKTTEFVWPVNWRKSSWPLAKRGARELCGRTSGKRNLTYFSLNWKGNAWPLGKQAHPWCWNCSRCHGTQPAKASDAVEAPQRPGPQSWQQQ